MFALLSIICFGLSYLLAGLQAHTNEWFNPLSLIALGLFLGGLHIVGAGKWIPRP